MRYFNLIQYMLQYLLKTKLLIISPPMANALKNLSGRNSSYHGANDVPTPATSNKTIANIIGIFLPYLYTNIKKY